MKFARRFCAWATITTTIFMISCQSNTQNEQQTEITPAAGPYRFTLSVDTYELPFNAVLETDDGRVTSMTISNGEERIKIEDIVHRNDSIIINIPVYNSVLKGRIESENLITGKFLDLNKSAEHAIPFAAEHGKTFRFTNTISTTNLPGRYRTTFSPGTKDSTEAILEIQNEKGQLKATFLTETGDYRFLEGNIMNDKVYLSTFDGTHAYYFEADIQGDSLVNGVYRSGAKYETAWEAKADSLFQLSDPKELTSLKNPSELINFNLPNQNGDTMTWESSDLQNKVVIVEIMGSWCPNCRDATLALKELTAKYNEDKVTIIPVAFELTDNQKIAHPRISKMQRDLGINSDYLFAGYASKENATEKFPMLNEIISYPTIIFIGKDRKVKRIHTGFYGPGTGKHYQTFMEESADLLRDLVD